MKKFQQISYDLCTQSHEGIGWIILKHGYFLDFMKSLIDIIEHAKRNWCSAEISLISITKIDRDIKNSLKDLRIFIFGMGKDI